ncbi:DNA repair protein RecO [Crenothrix polyspora]|uniref:DNA repair protein RecO n=1 Tax=Crenothrix polyspora TaxID=360316 RepID=A0A1R4HCW6_9GAMM|nr:DNA repair protein RecO [Crenothrix polyspora]SJM94049.1 DNA repair protein RecO [Crenothrix polyspora]
MTCNAIYGQPGFILKQRKYRETSLIIDVFTRDFGRFSLLAKGVRKAKSKTAALLQPFVPLSISYIGNGELKILTNVDVFQPALELKGLALYCGFYISELVICFLHQYDPHPEVFNDYNACLTALATLTDSEIEVALRIFEINLIEEIGYGLQLEVDFLSGQAIHPVKKYTFDVEQGAYEDEQGDVLGSTLLALRSKKLHDPQALSEAKLLMRAVIDFYLQGRLLKSRHVINQIIKRMNHE